MGSTGRHYRSGNDYQAKPTGKGTVWRLDKENVQFAKNPVLAASRKMKDTIGVLDAILSLYLFYAKLPPAPGCQGAPNVFQL